MQEKTVSRIGRNSTYVFFPADGSVAIRQQVVNARVAVISVTRGV